ncbi:MAG: MucBP domain-containing protein [Aerococcus sp.]|nr:MucBP domain-containing protein [Aerococcus sp.]
MVGKNNKDLLNQKMSKRVTRWGIRRLNVGVASIAIATGFLLAGGISEMAQASELLQPTSESVEVMSEEETTTDVEAESQQSDVESKEESSALDHSEADSVVSESNASKESAESSSMDDKIADQEDTDQVEDEQVSESQTSESSQKEHAEESDAEHVEKQEAPESSHDAGDTTVDVKPDAVVDDTTPTEKQEEVEQPEITFDGEKVFVDGKEINLSDKMAMNLIGLDNLERLAEEMDAAGALDQRTTATITDPKNYPNNPLVSKDEYIFAYYDVYRNGQAQGIRITMSVDRKNPSSVYFYETNMNYTTLYNRYTVAVGKSTTSQKNDYRLEYYNDGTSMAIRILGNGYQLKGTYSYGEIDDQSPLYENWTTSVPELIDQTIKYVDESGNEIATIVPQTGLTGQVYTTDDEKVVDGYYLDERPAHSSGTMSQYGIIGKDYTNAFHDEYDTTIQFTQVDDSGRMHYKVSMPKINKTYEGYLAVGESVDIKGTYNGRNYSYTVTNPYIDQTRNIVYKYKKMGSLIPTGPDNKPIPGVDPVPYPNDPKDPSKPGQPVIPDVPGFTPVGPDGQPLKPGDKYPIDPSKPGEDTEVHYVANDQKATVSFIDDVTGKTIHLENLTGKSGTASAYTTAEMIAQLEKQGYKLVSDNFPANGLVFDTNDAVDQAFEVHLTHQTIPVTPDKPSDVDIDELVHKVTQTVNYVDEKGNTVAKEVVDEVTFERTGVKDLVTGDVTFGEWQAKDGDATFDAKTSPVVNGYYTEKVQVDASTVNATDQNQVIDVVYHKLGNLIPVDKDGQPMPGVDPVPYPNDPQDPTRPGQPVIPNIPGFTPVGPDGQPLKPGDKYPIDPAKPGEDTEVQYIANEQQATVTFIDDETGKTIHLENLTGGSGSRSDYTTAAKIKELEALGYELVSDNFPANGLVFDTDDTKDQAFEVHFKHKKQPVTPDQPGDTDIDQLVHKVTQTVHYVDEQGQTVAKDVTDEVTFERTGVKDLVTGDVTFGEWQAKDGDATFDVKVSPTINGYTAKTPEIAETTVTSDAQSKDHEHTVVYTKNDQKATVTFIDDVTGQPIHVENLTGKGGEESSYTTAEKIAELEKQGYKLVSDNFPADGLTFDMDDTKDQAFEVHFVHQTIPVTPDKPGEPNQPVDPNNPDGPHFPEGTDKDSLSKDVTQTIHYVDDKGQPIKDDVVDKVTFEREGVVDLVTGTVTYTEWQAKDGDDTFDAKESPVVNGYYADRVQVDASTVTEADKDQEITVVYNPLGNLIPVDENGQPMPDVNPVPYPNDPKDPTKPGLPVIPDIPGYTPVDGNGTPLKPGDTYPIDTNKPGEDTPVKYVANEQKATVSFIDDVTGQTIHVEALAGKGGTTSPYATVEMIAELEKQGYKLVSDNFPADGLVFDMDDTKDQAFEVHLTHQTIPVTPDKPSDVDIDELVHKVTQTVHYVDEKGNTVAKEVVDEVTFERSGVKDLVTGDVTFGEWQAKDNDNTFDAKTSPVVNGYYTDKAQVDASTVNATDQNQVIDVVYHKLGNLIPVDENGQPMPDVNPVPYPNDPKDPTKPGLPVIPDIPGYTPVDGNGTPLKPGDTYPIDTNKPGEDTPVKYVANEQKATVSFIDDVTGQTIHVEALAGKGGTKSDYTTAEMIAQLEKQGYKLVSDNFPADGLTFDMDDTKDQAFEVHFVHQTIPVTPDKPGEPNQPVDPNNPDGPHFPEGTDKDSLSKDVTQTIHYVDDKGQPIKDDVVDKVTFEREGVVDLVTGTVTYTEWQAKDGDDTFDAKESPVVNGYYADRVQVDASTVTEADKDQEITVVYNPLGNLIPVDENGQPMPDVNPVPYPNDPKDPTKPGQPIIPDIPGYTPVDGNGTPLKPGDTYPIDTNKPGEDTPVKYVADDQNVIIRYVDKTTGEEITSVIKTGKTGEKVDYSTTPFIQQLINQGYQLVSDGYPQDGVIYDNDKTVDQIFTVELEHRVIPITPDKPGEPNKPVDPDNPDGPHFPEGTDKDSLVNEVNQTIHYVDENGQPIAPDVTDKVIFEREGTVDLVTGQIIYTDWKAKDGDDTFDAKTSPVIDGYYADRGQVDASTVTEADKDQEITVTYNKLGSLVPDVPGSDKVPYPNDPKDPTKPGQPIIPDIPGYTPVDPDGKPLKPGDPYPIDPNKPGEDTPIHYEANDQKATVTFIDDETGKTIHLESLTGKTGALSDYSTADKIKELEALGYELVSDNFPADGLVFDADDAKDQNFEVHFKHKKQPVTPDQPGDTDIKDLVHKVTQTVHYVDKDGNPIAEDVVDEVTFERTGVKDLVTGEVTFGDWQAVDGDETFDAKTSPVIEGFYADKAQVDASTVTVDSENQEITVTYNKLGSLVPDVPGTDKVPYPNDPKDPTKPGQPIIPDIPGYTPVDPDGKPLKPGDPYPIDPNKPGEDTPIHYEANDQKATVTFIDDVTGKPIHVETLTGKGGSTSPYTTAEQIKALEAMGYKLVSDNYPENGVVFDKDDTKDQNFEVHFVHQTVPVTPDKPGQPGEPVDPENPEGPKYPDGTDVDSLTHKVSQTVHYVDKDGNPLATDVVDEVIFERTGTIDLVTGEVIYTDWKAKDDDNIFDAKTSPVINGYYTDQKQVDQVTVNVETDNQEITIVYNKLGHLVPDVPGVDPVPYPNDPTDPSKPGQPIIPDVPGYTPVDPDGNPLKPGDPYPVDPEHPGEDTPIHYEPNKLPDKPEIPGDNGDNDEVTPTPDQPTDQQTDNSTPQANLPQTGASTDNSSLFGGALLAIVGALQFGASSKKHKKEDE